MRMRTVRVTAMIIAAALAVVLTQTAGAAAGCRRGVGWK